MGDGRDMEHRGHAIGTATGWSRRSLLSLIATLPLLPLMTSPALAAAERKGLLARTVRLAPMTLPGRTQFGLVRIQADLLLRERKDLIRDLETVNAMRPRIIGRLTQTLAEEKPVPRGASADDITRLKARMTEISNDAIGQSLVEDVLIVSLLVN